MTVPHKDGERWRWFITGAIIFLVGIVGAALLQMRERGDVAHEIEARQSTILSNQAQMLERLDRIEHQRTQELEGAASD